MQSLELSQTEKLELSALLSHGEHDDIQEAQGNGPRFPLPRHCLAGNVPRAPRNYYGADMSEGECTIEGIEEEDETPRERDVMPSRGNRGQVVRELRAMGYSFGE